MIANLEHKLWFSERRQERRWLHYHMKQHTFGKIPHKIQTELSRLMRAKTMEELEAILNGGALQALGERIYAQLKQERTAAKAEQGLDQMTQQAADWWAPGEGEEGGKSEQAPLQAEDEAMDEDGGDGGVPLEDEEEDKEEGGVAWGFSLPIR